jgi:hypothetical protein
LSHLFFPPIFPYPCWLLSQLFPAILPNPF